MDAGRVVMGLLFYPRGGSAQVTRYLAMALGDAGWSIPLVSGSLGTPGDETHAPTFFDGIKDLHHLDYTAALDKFDAGGSALRAAIPLHPSYEDRSGAADVIITAVDPAVADHLASAWDVPFTAADAGTADVIHLHHLTPQHDIVARRWPDVPRVTHLHGTEIKLIEAIEERITLARALGLTLATLPAALDNGDLSTAALGPDQVELLHTTRWSMWRHGEAWLERMRRQAMASDHLVTVSPPDRVTAISLFGLGPDRITAVPNGVDIDRFRPQVLTADERRGLFRHWLIDDPQGWDESGEPGSVAYGEADLDRLLGPTGDTTVLMNVGRFTGAKRMTVLIEAFAKARGRSTRPMSLVIWGGHPNEWEDEHPVAAARRLGTDGIFFAGWRGHDDLPTGLAACDVLVTPSVNDSYPQTALEAMAAGLPVVGTHSGGFPSMINLDPSRPTGWLVEPDDVDSLVDAIVEVVDNPGEQAERGAAALSYARANLSWAGRVRSFSHVYAIAREHRARAAAEMLSGDPARRS